MIETVLNNIENYIYKNHALNREYFKKELEKISNEEILNFKEERVKDVNKISPLEYAILTGDLSLVQKFAVPNMINVKSDNNGSYPLFTSIWGGDLTVKEKFEITRLLLQKGANPNVINRLGESPLNKAVIFDKYQDLVLLLLENGAQDERDEIYTHQTIIERWLRNKNISLEIRTRVQEILVKK